MPRPPTIAFFGNFGTRNLGNEGTLRAILRGFRSRFPDADFICICTDPPAAEAIHNITTFDIKGAFLSPPLLRSVSPIKLLGKILVGAPIELYQAFRILRKVDMLILPGTQFLSDNLTGPWGWPYFAFRWSIAAKLSRCELAFVSVGVGPLHRRLSRFFIASALRLARYRSFRDDPSRDYVCTIGLDAADDPIYPDLAFSLSIPTQPPDGIVKESKRTIGVGVMDYKGQHRSWPRHLRPEETYRRYVRRTANFIGLLLARDYVVRLLIGDVTYDAEVVADIRKVLTESKAAYPPYKLIVEPIESLEDLLQQVSTCDVIVSPRFHNILFGLSLNKLVLAISYHTKFAKLLESGGLERALLPIDDEDSLAILERFFEIERNGDKLREQIKLNVERYRVALDQQYCILFQLLTSDRHRPHRSTEPGQLAS